VLTRRRNLLLLLGPVLLVAVLSLAAQRVISNVGGTSGAQPAFEGGVLPAGVRAPDFRLRDQDGRLATMGAYRGRTVVVTFVYSTCKDTCPLTVQQIRGALDQLGHDVPVLAISVDPRADTPAHVRAFVGRQHMAGRMRYLVGTSAQLDPVWRRYGIQKQSVEAEHTAATFIVDGTGRARVAYLASQLTPEALAHDLRVLAG
jgi:protein SCO1